MSKKALVDSDKILGLVDQLRVAVPQDIAEAEEVLRKREDLLNQSLGEARRIRASAETEYRGRLDENELIQEAKKQAAELIEEAQQKAQHILNLTDRDAEGRRVSADQYAQDVLYRLEQEVAGLLTTVRHGISSLEGPKSAATL